MPKRGQIENCSAVLSGKSREVFVLFICTLKFLQIQTITWNIVPLNLKQHQLLHNTYLDKWVTIIFEIFIVTFLDVHLYQKVSWWLDNAHVHHISYLCPVAYRKNKSYIETVTFWFLVSEMYFRPMHRVSKLQYHWLSKPILPGKENYNILPGF